MDARLRCPTAVCLADRANGGRRRGVQDARANTGAGLLKRWPGTVPDRMAKRASGRSAATCSPSFQSESRLERARTSASNVPLAGVPHTLADNGYCFNLDAVVWRRLLDRIALVPTSSALDRDRRHFWSGHEWSSDGTRRSCSFERPSRTAAIGGMEARLIDPPSTLAPSSPATTMSTTWRITGQRLWIRAFRVCEPPERGGGDAVAARRSLG